MRTPIIIFIYGLPCAGKTTLGTYIKEHLPSFFLLDGDILRCTLNADLGYSDSDRYENLRRSAAMACLVADHGYPVVMCHVAPTSEIRNRIYEKFKGFTFISVCIDTDVDICIERDTKGMYKEALAGVRQDFPGVNTSFDIGVPDVLLKSSKGNIVSVEESFNIIMERITNATDA